MNRSQRRAAVIKGSIAAGLLCGWAGTAAIAPAIAEGGGYDGPNVSDHAAPGRSGPAVADGPGTASPERPRRGLRTPAASENPEWHPHPDWPCHIVWPILPFVPPLPYTGNRNGIISQAVGMQAPIAVLGGVADTGVHASTEIAGSAPAAAAPAAPPAATEPSGVPAAGLAVPELPPPAAPPPLPPQPDSVAAPLDSGRTGLPNRLQQTSLGRIAATALPGLAGIAALTALGGFLGYRQAKAGYVLRAAGTARFLR